MWQEKRKEGPLVVSGSSCALPNNRARVVGSTDGRRVPSTYLVTTLDAGRLASTTGISADEATVVAVYRPGPYQVVHVRSAFSATEVGAGDDLFPVKNRAGPALGASP